MYLWSHRWSQKGVRFIHTSVLGFSMRKRKGTYAEPTVVGLFPLVNVNLL